MRPRHRHPQAAILALAVAAARLPASATEAPDAMPLADYLGLLQQIAPAARQGAEAYLRAYRLRCGQSTSTGDLRLAMSRAGGEPTLMAMIKASQLQDTNALAALSRSVPCKVHK